ncbi:MAG: ABC transporter substrate-binding protein [Bacteroidota bacterium]|nr:ABC transporter substrate-binding protein [Bacteroidota bacterium]
MSKNIVISHILSNPDGLHPFNDNSVMRSFIFQYTQKSLVKLDLESLEYIPSMVKQMPTISDDGLRFEYELRDDLRWDDGSQVTAKDVEFTTKLQLCPLTDNAQIRGNYTSVIKSVELDSSNPLKFSMIAFGKNVTSKSIFSEVWIQQKSHWDPNGVLDDLSFDDIHSVNFKEKKEWSDWFNAFNHGDNRYKPERLVGLGPYQVSEWVTGSYIIVERKENWWGKEDSSIYNQSYPEEIIFKIIKDDASVFLSLKSEELDATNRIGTTKLFKLQGHDYFNKNYDSDFLNQYTYYYAGMNTRPDGVKRKAFFTDVRVRRAMAHLVPVDEIIEVLLLGEGSRQVSNVSGLKKVFNDTLQLINLDLEKAKQLLTEAGWVDTDDDNVRDKIVNGEKLQLSFEFSYMSSAASKETALMIKESMWRAGVDVKPNPMDFTLFYKNAQEHDFDMMLGGWGGSASYSNPFQLWHTSSWVNKGSNFCGFGDAYSDSLIDAANAAIDPEIHRDAMWKLQAKIYEDQPYIFMYSPKRKIVIHKRFNNTKMYFEKPGFILNNFSLKENYQNLTPTP